MIITEIDQKSLDELWELRRRHQEAVRQLDGPLPDRMIAFVASRIGERWEQDAPRLTGTLASATRERVFGGEGRVFIDPSIENPVLGGLPSIYGPVVHDRNPWVERVYRSDTPQIMSDMAQEFWGELDKVYGV